MKPENFEEAYHQFRSFVFVICKGYLLNEDDAEDAVMEVFLKAFLAIEQYNPERGFFKSWLAQIARNRCRDILKRQKCVALDETHIETGKTFSADPMVDNIQVNICLTRLVLEHREILILRHIERLTWSEIAAEMNLTEHQVRDRESKACQEMQKCLNGKL